MLGTSSSVLGGDHRLVVGVGLNFCNVATCELCTLWVLRISGPYCWCVLSAYVFDVEGTFAPFGPSNDCLLW